MKVVIIAEAGVNHNGSIETAKELIDVAAASGADYVKFQSFIAEKNITKSAPKAGYQIQNSGAEESQLDMVKKLELTAADHETLFQHCKLRNIKFLSTAFDFESVDLLQKYGLDYFKVPSGEITNLPYLRKAGSLGKKIILSTGMAELAEIGEALNVLSASGTPLDKITVLHCNTEYPTPMQDVNLAAMKTISQKFNVAVGYSDHTLGIEVPIAAVALGAQMIEKHFTLSRSMAGPDHRASLEPNELAQMVASIRNIEEALGSGVKTASPSELKNRSIARKSIVAAKNIKRGEIFNAENLTVKRPGTGLSPMLWDKVVGTAASRDYAVDDFIEESGDKNANNQ